MQRSHDRKQVGAFKGSKTGEHLLWTGPDEAAEVSRHDALKSLKVHVKKSKFNLFNFFFFEREREPTHMRVGVGAGVEGERES